jgi:hypothetical protein
VVTFDALHTVRAKPELAGTREEAHYIAVVKKNQPLLHARVRALPWRQVPAGITVRETGHGRIETRTLKQLTSAGWTSRTPARLSRSSAEFASGEDLRCVPMLAWGQRHDRWPHRPA